jgi:Rieske Fe-S protein
MLFELLSGQPLFTGSSPLDTAMQHVQHPLPSLRQTRPDVPIAVELVVNHALERDPNQRFQHVSELVEAFAQTCRGEGSHAKPHHNRSTSSMLNTSGKVVAVKENLSHMREENTSTGPWQFLPPVVTGKINAVSATGKQTNTPSLSASTPAPLREQKPPVQQAATHTYAQHDSQRFPVQGIAPESVKKDTDAMKTPDWWVQTPADPFAAHLAKQSEQSRNDFNAKDSHMEQSMLQSVSPSKKPARRSTNRSRSAGRRKVVALLATGSVAAVGVGVAAKMNLVHFIVPSTTSSMPPAVSTTTTNGHQSQMGNMGNMNGMGKGGTPTQNKPQGHTGAVVGTTDLGINQSMGFLNASDGKASLLIHLPSGKFVAYERACTHEGVSVNYDPVTHKLVCPAHGAIFDPTNNAAVLQGPATRPLTPVTIRVNADGTITTV